MPLHPQSLPRPSPHVTLKSLPTDVLHRIINVLTHDAHRSCPYYPPKLLEHVLPLSQTCHHFHNAIATHLTSDLSWVNLPQLYADVVDPSLKRLLLDWYRAATKLTHLHLHAHASRCPNLRLRVTRNLLAHAPTLRHIDLVGVLSATSFEQVPLPSAHYDSDSYDGDDDEDEIDDGELDHRAAVLGSSLRPDFQPILATVSDLLAHVRQTLTSIRVEPLPLIIDAVAAGNLTAVQDLHVQHADAAHTCENLMQLVEAVNGRTVTTLTLACLVPFPNSLSPAALAALLPNLRTLNFHHGGHASALQARPPCVTALPLAFRSLTSLSFHNVYFGHVDDPCPDLWRLDFPQMNLHLVSGCKFARFAEVVPDVAALSVRQLELCSPLDGRQVDLLAAKCLCVHTLAVTVLRDGIDRLPPAVQAWQQLRSLHLSIPQAHGDEIGGRQVVEEHLVNAFARNAGPLFRKLVLHGETLCMRNASLIVRSLGERLEYLVTGLFTPFASRSKSIMWLLHVIRRHCANMRVLCFGLALVYDRWALQLNSVFLRDIEETGRCLRFLDTSWLKKNAANLKAMARPADFVDYDSQDEGAWGGR